MRHIEFTWSPRDTGGSLTVVEGLGLIEIYRDQSGNCVDINGKRAWSSWRESERMIQLAMQGHVRNWDYLNSFKV